jgi:hypothetical protein
MFEIDSPLETLLYNRAQPGWSLRQCPHAE